MADTKITALTAITTVDPAADVLPIVDVSDTSMAASGTTKKITSNQILGAGGTATLASATITGDLTVDTSTLKVDSANNRVGIGTATPATPLNIGTAVSRHFLANGQTTGSSYGEIITTGADVIYGAVDSAGGLFTNAIANASFFGSGIATSLQLVTNATSRYEISPTGVATWSNVGGVAGTAMTLNSTGLGVGGSPIASSRVSSKSSASQPYNLALQNRNATQNWYLYVDAAAVDDKLFTINDGTANRLIIDTSGNVGISVTPSAWASGTYKSLQIGQSSSISAGVASELVVVGSNCYFDTTDSRWERITSGYTSQYYQTGGTHVWRIGGTAGANTDCSFTSAMTLDASGNLLVAKTAVNDFTVGFQATPTGAVVSTLAASTDGTGSTMGVYSTGAAAYRFYVGMGGTVYATNTTISAISDARLKENVQDIDVGLGAILALKPRKFDWKEGKGKDIKGDRGFIAQEFEQVFPQLVDEWKDAAPEGEAPYKSVRQDLIPVLVKAIQELAAEVNALKNA